jgi:lysine/ornithine N-monooxygenase
MYFLFDMSYIMKKRRVPPHIVLPDGRWRFIKKSQRMRRPKKVKGVKMARYRRTRRAYAYAKKGYRSRKGLLSGSAGNIIIGAGAGFLSPMIPEFLGGWTKPLIFGAGGYLLKKPALLTSRDMRPEKIFLAEGSGTSLEDPEIIQEDGYRWQQRVVQ